MDGICRPAQGWIPAPPAAPRCSDCARVRECSLWFALARMAGLVVSLIAERENCQSV